MHFAIEALALVVTVLLVTAAASRFGFSAPLLLLLVGMVASFLPFSMRRSSPRS